MRGVGREADVLVTTAAAAAALEKASHERGHASGGMVEWFADRGPLV